MPFIHRIRRFPWLKMRQNRQFYSGLSLKSCARAPPKTTNSNFERGLQFIHWIRRFPWLKMRQNRKFYRGFTLKSCARACRPAGKRRQGNFSGRCSSGPKIASEWLKTTVLRPFPAALQGSTSRVIFPGGAVAVRKLPQNCPKRQF